jgi:hypothetical protein
MNTRYRIRFERSGVVYRKRYARSIEKARQIVWQRFSGFPHHMPRRAVIEGTRDQPWLGQKPRWDVREEWK